MVAPVKLKVLPLAVAVWVTDAHVPPTVNGDALTKPLGYVSVKLAPVCWLPVGLVKVNVNVALVLVAKILVLNALLIPSRATAKVAEFDVAPADWNVLKAAVLI